MLAVVFGYLMYRRHSNGKIKILMEKRVRNLKIVIKNIHRQKINIK